MVWVAWLRDVLRTLGDYFCFVSSMLLKQILEWVDSMSHLVPICRRSVEALNCHLYVSTALDCGSSAARSGFSSSDL